MQEEMALVDDSNTLKKIYNLHQDQDLNLKEQTTLMESNQIGEEPSEESNEKMKEECKISSSSFDGNDIIFNLEKMSFICVVMSQGEFSMNNYLNDITDENDIIVLLYNMIKALNFLHSANLIHRDIKPSNLLVDKYSRIMICDFGLSRNMPKLTENEKKLKHYRKDQYK